MNLRKFVVATALGATVLTAVPALIAPHEAAASACDQLTECGEGPGDTGGGGDDSGGGDTGGGDAGGGDTGGGDTGGGDTGGGDMGGGDMGGGGEWSGGGADLGGNIGDFVGGSPSVTIVGRRDLLPGVPAIPDTTTYSGHSGGIYGGAPGRDKAVPWSAGKRWTEPLPCLKNTNAGTTKLSQNTTYAVTYEVSANISAKAYEVLGATLDTKLNATVTRQLGTEVTLAAGQSWTADVEYQTMVYAIQTTSWGWTSTEFVNVTMPTGTLNFHSC
ncbi:DUF6426 family protein [Streptomyces sp. NPDC046876]|uniref:DUF6426 family protein n=1 Tax=Streptomyces sp. NPDC046876 TaxID=3155616 RepID=UPI0033F32EFA